MARFLVVALPENRRMNSQHKLYISVPKQYGTINRMASRRDLLSPSTLL